MDRENLKKKATKILLYLLIVTFILSSIGGIFFASNNRYDVIITDDNNVNINEFVKILNEEKIKSYSEDQSNDNLRYLISKNFMYDQLEKTLYIKLLDMEVNNYRLEKPKKLVISTIFKEKQFFKNEKFDVEQFKDILKENKLTELEYIELLQKQQTKEFFLNMFDDLIDSNNIIAKKFSDFYNLSKNVKIYSINKNLLKISIEQPTDEEIYFHYIDNKENFFDEEKRKIDYIVIKNNEASDKLKDIDSLIAKNKNIYELASAINCKVESLDYITEEEAISKNKDFKNLDFAFIMNKNTFSEIEAFGDDLYIFSVVDIKEKRQLEFEEAKDIVKNYLVKNNQNIAYKNLVNGYANDFKNARFKESILLDKKFKIRTQNITINSDNNNQFVINILKNKNNTLTDVYYDENNVYFALILNSRYLANIDKNYNSIDKIKGNFIRTSKVILQQEYLNYIKDYKYNVKLNYQLLDYIR